VNTYDGQSLWLIETWFILAVKKQSRRSGRTREVEEIGILVEVIEDSTGAILGVRGSNHRNSIVGKFRGKLRATMRILECSDAGRNWVLVS